MAKRPKIEKNIPLPIGSHWNVTVWDWMNEMEVGDSFLIPAGRIPTIRNAAARQDIKIATRRASSIEYRVWRTK